MLSEKELSTAWTLAQREQGIPYVTFAKTVEALVRAEVAAEPNPWRENIIDALCAAHIYRAEHDADPAKALNDLQCWEHAVSVDPAVSADARKLQDDARQQRGQWLPIETAPMDGTHIMLTNGGTVSEGWWEHEEPYVRESRGIDGHYIDQAESDGFADWLDCGGGMQPSPTHWMPIPKGPGDATDDAMAYPAAVPRGVLEAWERLVDHASTMFDWSRPVELMASVEWKAMAAAIKGAPAEPAPISAAEPMEMCLCESLSLVLRIGQPYVFKEMEGCEACKKLADEAREAYGPCGGASWAEPAPQRQPLSNVDLRAIANSFGRNDRLHIMDNWTLFSEFAHCVQERLGVVTEAAEHEPTSGDIETRVCAEIMKRQARGIAKYGQRLSDNPALILERLQHLLEGQLDGAIYTRWAMDALAAAPAAQPPRDPI